MADDCIFCKIVSGDIPATRVYEDDHVVAFVDTNPQAPTHVLVVPRRHFADLPAISRDAAASAGYLAGIRATAEQQGVAEFRTVFNTGAGVGQTVFHVHAHVLAGRSMGWPPG
ncbi:MAG: histidine triad family protein [Pseudonocardiales bacterium]|jgi:histidine triad (HIT) family protein|nr:histidine triad family protein [Pseudonocardiales bacterium]MDT4921193.1 histidine triad family protein [Pseudonocardiales bacterium]MDT4941083.1 histidine triad family protein [Pseudonocardiales bacterium]